MVDGHIGAFARSFFHDRGDLFHIHFARIGILDDRTAAELDGQIRPKNKVAENANYQNRSRDQEIDFSVCKEINLKFFHFLGPPNSHLWRSDL